MANKTMTEGISITYQGAVAKITFAHPKQNCFPQKQLYSLRDAIETCSNDNCVNVILLQSDPTKVFCAGASFDELLSVKSQEQGKIFFMGFANLINAMRNCLKPIVGRIHGKAIGGGVGIVAACDYVVATESSAVRLSELAIGIGPFVIAPVVARKIGVSALSDLSLQPKIWKDANWALTNGLFNEVCQDFESLENTVKNITNQLVKYAPEAVSELKKTLWSNTDHWEKLLPENAEISGRLLLLPETQKVLEKLKHKR
jgi:methylglutaconyl-CoA hydratase